MKTRIQFVPAAVLTATLTFGALLALGVEPQYTVKEVMKQAHKAPKGTDPTCKKAIEGKATKEEIDKLVEYYVAMSANKPPQGDEASWKEKCAKLLDAAKALQAGKPEAAAQYKSAVNCKACHSLHKPD
jgi:hypothetical protein